MDVMESDIASIWNDLGDVLECLSPFSLLLVVPVCYHHWTHCEIIGQLNGKLPWTAGLSCNVIILYLSPLLE